VALTPGDPRGIGPEIVARTMQDPPAGADYIVIGEWANLSGEWAYSRTGSPPAPITAREAGLAVEAQIEHVVRLAMSGEVDAIVTGPADKHALHLAGVPYPGHTEWLAALAGGVDVAMMLTDERLRVVLITTHLPLADVPAAVTGQQVLRVGNLTRRALRDWWGLDRPRLALCALNPHAGEQGLFGREDQEVLAPAARALDATGPLPADTVFVRALRGEFDAVLTPYHDVGMTAIKVAAFGRAVNVTLGLPFVRTAPDHGTALDIAGKGVADPSSFRAAVELAIRLVKREPGDGKRET
jgi:4-hydroxythreonine-4-phosphate dehydrogenase